jgi:hypothetical protein
MTRGTSFLNLNLLIGGTESSESEGGRSELEPDALAEARDARNVPASPGSECPGIREEEKEDAAPKGGVHEEALGSKRTG